MFYRILSVMLVVLLAACRQNPKQEPGTDVPDQQSPMAEVEAEAPSEVGSVETTRHFCFASRTETPGESGDTFSYQFMRLQIDEGRKVTGWMINAPYGTDGSRGSLRGVYREDQALVQTTTTYLAEGELYEEQRDYRIGEGGLATLDAEKQPVFSIPAVSCEQFDSYLEEYQQGILRARVNTSDRTRLKKLKEAGEFGFSGDDLAKLRFMEVEVDLDHNYETREFLLYIMDPMVCGSGGCNLFIVDEGGTTLSNTSVVKLPVYMPTSTVGDMDRKGVWKSLYVWSQGFRELVPEKGRYPSNASMAPGVPEGALAEYPEKYRLVLDYLE